MGLLKDYCNSKGIKFEHLSVLTDVAPSILREIDSDPTKNITILTINKIYKGTKNIGDISKSKKLIIYKS